MTLGCSGRRLGELERAALRIFWTEKSWAPAGRREAVTVLITASIPKPRTAARMEEIAAVEAPVRHPSHLARYTVSNTALISSRLRVIAVPIGRAVAYAVVTVTLPIGRRDQAPWAA
jgi:hypothetical protein